MWKNFLKKFLKDVAVSVASMTAMVAIDQAVRTIVNEKLKPFLAKKKEQ